MLSSAAVVPVGVEPQRAPRTILFCREVTWNTRMPVRDRKLAERFAIAGWRVIWVLPPRRAPSGATLSFQLAASAEPARITELRPRTLVPFSLRLPVLWRPLASGSWQGCRPSLAELISRAGLAAPDVLWLSHVSALGLPRLFPGAPVLWHVTDDYPLLSRNPR